MLDKQDNKVVFLILHSLRVGAADKMEGECYLLSFYQCIFVKFRVLKSCFNKQGSTTISLSRPRRVLAF